MSDDERKLNRRRFLKYSAVAGGTAAAWYGLTARTDADDVVENDGGRGNAGGSPYHYHDE